MTTHSAYDRTRLVSLVALFVFGTLVATLSAGAVATQHTVEAGSTISTAGTYQLAANASNTTASKGLTVTGSPVEIDGHGERLDGPGTRGSIGIYAPGGSNASSLVVRNLTLSGWGTGIRTSNVSTVTIRNTVVRSNHTGVRIDGANTVRIENSTLVVDDGTVFEDVDRVILENTSIRTIDSESIIATNTTVYVGRNVRLSGGLRVRRGVVEFDDTKTPTVGPESGDSTADAEMSPGSETEIITGVPQATQPTTAPPRGVESGLGGGYGDGSSGGGGGSGGTGGGSGGGSAAVSAPQDDTTTPTVSITNPADETVGASNTTMSTVADGSESTRDQTETTEDRQEQGQEGETSRDSSLTTSPASTVATTQADDFDESTTVQNPGFGVIVAVSALGVWSIRRVHSD
ncbi:hypothetical protein [Haloferax sp. DFSO52]|uniref:hypothetical protein n=1 Tax=Haloferax sp. DFSO52 TaxID=3388505 RepID=UPI003A850BFF